MKKSLALLLLTATLAGCMINRPATAPSANSHAAAADAAEAKLAAKLRLVTPESVTPQNYATKVREMEDELNFAARRGEAARTVADAQK